VRTVIYDRGEQCRCYLARSNTRKLATFNDRETISGRDKDALPTDLQSRLRLVTKTGYSKATSGHNLQSVADNFLVHVVISIQQQQQQQPMAAEMRESTAVMTMKLYACRSRKQ